MPAEGEEFTEFGKVAGVGSDYGDAKAASAGGDKGLVCRAAPGNLLIVMFGSEFGEDLAGLGPVAEMGDHDAASPFKVAFKTFDGAAAACVCASVEFFQNHGAQPQWFASREIFGLAGETTEKERSK